MYFFIPDDGHLVFPKHVGVYCMYKRNLVYTCACVDAIIKGKTIPVEVWIGPEGSRRLRLPDSQSAHEGGKVGSPTHRMLLCQQRYALYLPFAGVYFYRTVYTCA
jgi:hypothetical protein